MFAGLLLVAFLISFYSLFAPAINFTSAFVHSYCVEFTPHTSWSFAYEAIVCGSPLPPSQFRSSLQVVGLIHLMVVSGSHLVFIATFLEYFLNKFSAHGWITSICLITFTLMTGVQAPAVRALVAFAVRTLDTRAKLFWRPQLQVFIAGFLTLILFPQWITSYSMLLSWSAAFALTLSAQSDNQLRLHTLIFLVLYPVTLPISPPHPVSIVANWLLGPVIGMLLFPLSILAYVIPSLAFLTDRIWGMLESLLTVIAKEIPINSANPANIPLAVLWLYLFSLNIGVHLYHVYRRRGFSD